MRIEIEKLHKSVERERRKIESIEDELSMKQEKHESSGTEEGGDEEAKEAANNVCWLGSYPGVCDYLVEYVICSM